MSVTALTVAACGSGADSGAAPAVVDAAASRVAQIQHHLDQWADASDLDEAQAAAEAVSNLITGPGVSLYGDANGDGSVGGEVIDGLLPGETGEASLALPLRGCAGADLLGGSWVDPGSRWGELEGMIAAWSPVNNPFPQLASHAQRTVGWAQLTLASSELGVALEFSGHAQLHVDAIAAAVADCD